MVSKAEQQVVAAVDDREREGTNALGIEGARPERFDHLLNSGYDIACVVQHGEVGVESEVGEQHQAQVSSVAGE